MPHTFKNIIFETTTICNSKCACCPREEFYDSAYGTMPMDLFEKIILDIRDNHVVTGMIRTGGMGDASCDKLLLERLRFIRKNAPDLKVELLSNMERWKETYTTAIVSEGLIAQMRFSILAYSEEGSTEVYGGPDKAKLSRGNIDKFLEINEGAGNPIPTSIYTLEFDGMESDVASIKDEYWDRVDEFEVWKPHTWANLFPELRELTQERLPCSSVDGMAQPLIGVYGDVVPCSMDINYSLSLGSLRLQNFEEILSGNKCTNLQRLNSDGDIETLETCKGCVYLNADSSEVLLDSKATEHSRDRHAVAI